MRVGERRSKERTRGKVIDERVCGLRWKERMKERICANVCV